MSDLKNKEIRDLIEKILNDTGEERPVALLEELYERLYECSVFCPVEDDEMLFLRWGQHTFIPAFCDLDDYELFFENNDPEIFEFKHLKDFITSDVDGIMVNPGKGGYILDRFAADMIFNIKRTRSPVSKGYDVKVRLNDFRPLTWRDLIIPDNITFMELDDILKTLWGFYGHHLSCFLIPKTNQIIIDDELGSETMMGCDFNANETLVSEIFDEHSKITYWYDFGDDWRFDIEIKKKIDYDKDYVTVKRFKGKYNPVEDCKGVYGLSEIVYYAENPDEADSSYFSELAEYLEEFDMDYIQFALKRKAYVRSQWHRSEYFR